VPPSAPRSTQPAIWNLGRGQTQALVLPDLLPQVILDPHLLDLVELNL